VKEMEKIKAIVLLVVSSVLLLAIVGVTYAQFASAQTGGVNSSLSQTSQITKDNTYPTPHQGYYPAGSTQPAFPNGYGMGMGMCNRHW